MSHSFTDLLSTPGAASLFDPTAQASSLSTSYPSTTQVDLSDVDFDYLTQCTNPQSLHSIVAQLEREPFPELLAAARRRLEEVDEGVREAGERRRREVEEKQAMTSELEQWIRTQKQKEQTNKVDITVAATRKQPPVRGAKPAAAAALVEEPVVVGAVAGGKVGVEGVMSEEEKRQRVASEKQKGNECYKAGEYTTAAEHYSTAITLLPPPYNTTTSSIHPTSFTSSSPSSPSTTATTYDFTLHTNLAITQLRLQNHTAAVNTASAALTLSHGTAVKAWWRRAQAYAALGRLGEAARDLREGISRAEEGGKVREEMERELRKAEMEIEAQKEREKGKVASQEKNAAEEKRQMEEERKEKTRADTAATTTERLKRMTIVEDDSDEEEEEDEKASSQPVFKAPRGGMTIEVLK